MSEENHKPFTSRIQVLDAVVLLTCPETPHNITLHWTLLVRWVGCTSSIFLKHLNVKTNFFSYSINVHTEDVRHYTQSSTTSYTPLISITSTDIQVLQMRVNGIAAAASWGQRRTDSLQRWMEPLSSQRGNSVITSDTAHIQSKMSQGCP